MNKHSIINDKILHFKMKCVDLEDKNKMKNYNHFTSNETEEFLSHLGALAAQALDDAAKAEASARAAEETLKRLQREIEEYYVELGDTSTLILE